MLNCVSELPLIAFVITPPSPVDMITSPSTIRILSLPNCTGMTSSLIASQNAGEENVDQLL